MKEWSMNQQIDISRTLPATSEINFESSPCPSSNLQHRHVWAFIVFVVRWVDSIFSSFFSDLSAKAERPCSSPTRLYVWCEALQAIAIYATDDKNNSKKPISVRCDLAISTQIDTQFSFRQYVADMNDMPPHSKQHRHRRQVWIELSRNHHRRCLAITCDYFIDQFALHSVQ